MTLDSSPFLAGAAKAAAIAKGLARQFSSNPIKFTGLAAFAGAEKAIKGAAGGLGMLSAGAFGAAALGFKVITGGALVAGGALAAGIGHAYNFGSELQDMADRTGIGVKSLVVLKTALNDAGVDFEALLPSIGKMQQQMVKANEEGGVSPFSKLNLDVEELIHMDPGEAFGKIGDALAKVNNEAQRSALGKQIFGKGGMALKSMFADPKAMENAKQAVGGQADILADNAGAFDRISDILGHTGVKLRGFFVGAASGFSDALLPILEQLDKADLAGIGRSFAETMKDAAAWVQVAWADPAGTLAYFWAEAKLQAANFANFANESLRAMFPDAAKSIDEWIFSAQKFTAELAAGLEFAFGVAKQAWEAIVDSPMVKAFLNGIQYAQKLATDAAAATERRVNEELAADVVLKRSSPEESGISTEETERIYQANANRQKFTGETDRVMVDHTISDMADAIERNKAEAARGPSKPSGEPSPWAAESYETIRNRRMSELNAAPGAPEFIGPVQPAGMIDTAGLQANRDAAALNREGGTLSIAERFAQVRSPMTMNHMPAPKEMLLAHLPVEDAAPELGTSFLRSHASTLEGASLAGGLDRMKAGGRLSTFNTGAVPDSLLRKADRDAVRAGIIGGPDEAARLRAGNFSTTEIRHGDAARRKAAAKASEEAALREKTGKQTDSEALNKIAANSAKQASNTAKLTKGFGFDEGEDGEE